MLFRSHNVGTCYRCHHTVEPLVSTQWFVRMKPLAEPAIEAVRSGKTQFVPELSLIHISGRPVWFFAFDVLIYMEIQPKALAMELMRMIAAKMGHR